MDVLKQIFSSSEPETGEKTTKVATQENIPRHTTVTQKVETQPARVIEKVKDVEIGTFDGAQCPEGTLAHENRSVVVMYANRESTADCPY